MKLVRLISGICLCCCCGGWALAQDPSPGVNPALKHRSAKSTQAPKFGKNDTLDLVVPAGSGLPLALDQEVRIQRVGQPLHGHLTEPVYAFDKLVLPVGTEIDGQILQIDRVPTIRRIAAALDTNFTPASKITVGFSELSLDNGKHISLQTRVQPGSGQVLRFVSGQNQKKPSAKSTVSEKARQAKEQAQSRFDAAMQQVKKPGKLHRLERYVVAQLPVHPNYIEAGTRYVAELQSPLEFGSEPLTLETLTSLDSEIPDGTFVHATLTTPLNSASTRKGADVEAVISRPLLTDGKLILPQGSILKGSVVQVRPARRWKRNGQLRFVFRDLVLPNGLESKIEATLQGVQSATSEDLKLDSEGGAEPQTSRVRYLKSGVAVGLAAATHEDETLNRAEGGAGGFRVIGIVVGTAVHSQPLAIAMGAFGASRSIYSNFIGRGTDVAFEKHTEMEIGIATRNATGPLLDSPRQ